MWTLLPRSPFMEPQGAAGNAGPARSNRARGLWIRHGKQNPRGEVLAETPPGEIGEDKLEAPLSGGWEGRDSESIPGSRKGKAESWRERRGGWGGALRWDWMQKSFLGHWFVNTDPATVGGTKKKNIWGFFCSVCPSACIKSSLLSQWELIKCHKLQLFSDILLSNDSK